MLFNASINPVDFELPEAIAGTKWYLVVDTSLQSPRDLLEPGQEQLLANSRVYSLSGRASAILLAKNVLVASKF